MNGENAEKRGKVDKQWWGKRPLSGLTVARSKGMKYFKRLLHKIERRQSDFYCLDELINNAAEDFDCPKCKVQCEKCREYASSNSEKKY